MTREVPRDRPLSEEDRTYLHARGLHAVVDQMDEAFPPNGDEEAVTETRPNWESMTLAELQAEVARINNEYAVEPPLSSEGKKAEIVARLDEWWNRPE